MIRILVADTWGQDASPALKQRYPNVKFTVHTPAPSPHPHGHMVAECILRLLPPGATVEIVFYPYLTLQSQPEHRDGWVDVIRGARLLGRPFHFCNCSFGASTRETLVEAFMYSYWKEPQRFDYYRQAIGQTIVIFASGNSDKSTSRRADTRNDVGFPQRVLSAIPNVFLVGANDHNGVPTPWSSDGMEVSCMTVGAEVPVEDPVAGRRVRVQGTSFAAPHFTGDLVAAAISGADVTPGFVTNHILTNATVADGWPKGQRHPKAGYGCMNASMRRRLISARRLEDMVEPLEALPLAYHDLEPMT